MAKTRAASIFALIKEIIKIIIIKIKINDNNLFVLIHFHIHLLDCFICNEVKKADIGVSNCTADWVSSKSVQNDLVIIVYASERHSSKHIAHFWRRIWQEADSD